MASIIGMVASHIDTVERLISFRRCLRSVKQQRQPLSRLHVSCSGLKHEEAADVMAEETSGMEVSFVHCEQRRSQFEHLRELFAAQCDSLSSAFILFGDDDDIWSPDRVAVYSHLLAARVPDDTDGLSLEWAALPCASSGIELNDADAQSTVDGMLLRGQASIKEMSVYFMIACRMRAVRAFFEACPMNLVRSKFCDIAFKNHMLERTKCVRFAPDDSASRTLVKQGSWLIYYNNDKGISHDEVELRDYTSPSAFFVGNGGSQQHASDISCCSPDQIDRLVVSEQMPNLQRVSRLLAGCGLDAIAHHLARHRTRMEMESAGWFGQARPPSRSEVETLFIDIERGRGGTSALAALLGNMQHESRERRSLERAKSGLIRRASYVSYDKLAELGGACSEMSAAEQAVAFDCVLLRAAQPLRTILLRFGMDTRPADLFEAQLEQAWQARCEHLVSDVSH